MFQLCSLQTHLHYLPLFPRFLDLLVPFLKKWKRKNHLCAVACCDLDSNFGSGWDGCGIKGFQQYAYKKHSLKTVISLTACFMLSPVLFPASSSKLTCQKNFLRQRTVLLYVRCVGQKSRPFVCFLCLKIHLLIKDFRNLSRRMNR